MKGNILRLYFASHLNPKGFLLLIQPSLKYAIYIFMANSEQIGNTIGTPHYQPVTLAPHC